MAGLPDEAALARAAAGGDGVAFARLYDPYEARIYTFCHRLVSDEQDAQDAMTTTPCTATAAAGCPRGGSAPTT